MDEIHSSKSKPASSKATEKAEQHQSGFKFLGDNEKNILLVVNYTQAVHLPDEQLNFITSILTACKLGLADVAILNISNNKNCSYKNFQQQLGSRQVFLFGIEPKQIELPVQFPEFQIQPFNNCTYLIAPSLQELENDKLLKSKLWVCLKKIFNL